VVVNALVTGTIDVVEAGVTAAAVVVVVVVVAVLAVDVFTVELLVVVDEEQDANTNDVTIRQTIKIQITPFFIWSSSFSLPPINRCLYLFAMMHYVSLMDFYIDIDEFSLC
jgi:hypothetical protein